VSDGVYIFGYSGHSYVVIETLLRMGRQVLGYFDRQVSIRNPYGLDHMGDERKVDVAALVKENHVFPTVGDNSARAALIDFFTSHGLNQLAVVDPSSNVSATALIGLSTYVGRNVCVNAMAHIGRGVILNTSCVVEHGCRVADYAHVAPSAVMCGDVHLGVLSFLGANSVVRQTRRIGDRVVIGAGSVVLRDIPDGEVWFGNPARRHTP
jgi:sugar O-acyltransferase (sialic acid O-acetyltransferase NeuD family)